MFNRLRETAFAKVWRTQRLEKSQLTNLSHRRSQEVDYPVVGDGDDALTVDLDDAVADAHPAALGDAAAEQTADLEKGERCFD